MEVIAHQVERARKLWRSGVVEREDIMAAVSLTLVQAYAITCVARDNQSDEEVAARVNEIPEGMTCKDLHDFW